MVKLLVLGAKLQGMEAIYLGRKAGYDVTVIDRNPSAPGADLADHFIQADLRDRDRVLPVFRKADVILPVIEDRDLLHRIRDYGNETETLVIFDWKAYELSSSKEKSNELFRHYGLPLPGSYPYCSYPVILKPDGSSGSSHVVQAGSEEEVKAYLKSQKGGNTVIQEYLEGPSYSLEVIGDGEHFYYPQTTEVVVDQDYDCKRIVAPAELSEDERRQMLSIGEKLAETIKIRGIFDIEVISDGGQLKLLEIDARLPSQTPVSVYHSTGINMVGMLVEMALGQEVTCSVPVREQVCYYQQIQVEAGKVRMLGEHIMASCMHMRILEDFYGADVAITDYRRGSRSWRAIVIVTGDSHKEADRAWKAFLKKMMADTGIADWEYTEG